MATIKKQELSIRHLLPSNFIFDSKSSIHIELLRSIISNFIQLLTHKDIRLLYNSSYSTDNLITKDYIFFEFNTSLGIDNTIGIHLYKACRLILTNLDLINDFKLDDEFIKYCDVNRDTSKSELYNQFRFLCNYKEYQRSFKYVNDNAAGYYKYAEMIKQAFSRKVNKAKLQKLFIVKKWQSFEFNLLNDITTDYDLDKFITTIPDSTSDIIKLCYDYLKTLHYNHFDTYYLINKEFRKLPDKQQNNIKNALKKQSDFVMNIHGEYKLTKLKYRSSRALSNCKIDVAGSTVIDNNLVDIIRINQFNNTIIDNNLFNLFEINAATIKKNTNSILAGIQLGKNITNKLKFRTVEYEQVENRLKSGQINKRLLHELSWGSENVYHKKIITKHEKQHIIFTIDYSKSMINNHSKMLTLLTSLIYAFKKINNLDITVYLRYTISDGNDIKPTLLKIFDKNDSFNKVKTKFKYLKCSGGSPEGILHAELYKQYKNQNVSFINISDGNPLFLNGKLSYTGELSIEHTKKYARLLIKNSKNFLSFFIGNDDEHIKTFNSIYGKTGFIVNDNNLLNIGKIINNFLI